MTPLRMLALIDDGLSVMAAAGSSKPSVGAGARCLLLAIAGQEGNLRDRRQIGGPARSFWQFEKGGGVAAVLGHQVAGPWVIGVCSYLNIPYTAATVFEAMAWNDPLAVTMARLLLWTDAAALPALGSQDEAWAYYDRLWAPGKPGPDRWPENYQAALAAVRAVP